MAKRKVDRIARVVAEVEKVAKALRADVRKRVKARPLLKALQNAAERLRERAVKAAGEVEKYVHEIRRELEGSQAPKRGVRRRRTRRATA